MQEAYKYLSNNKSRAFSNALEDYLGSLFSVVMRSSIIEQSRERGPFQIFRFRPKQRTLPLSQQEFDQALESTLPNWKKLVLQALTHEVSLQNGVPSLMSPDWMAFYNDLPKNELFKSNPQILARMNKFICGWQAMDSQTSVVDASKMLKSFLSSFNQDTTKISENYTSFLRTFDFQYKRRNMRLSFVIALLLTLTCNLPLQKLYFAASRMDTSASYQMLNRFAETNKLLLGDANSTKTQSSEPDEMKVAIESMSGLFDYTYPPKLFHENAANLPAYLLGCLMTSLLISYGAPLLNSLADMALKSKMNPQPNTGTSNGTI